MCWSLSSTATHPGSCLCVVIRDYYGVIPLVLSTREALLMISNRYFTYY